MAKQATEIKANAIFRVIGQPCWGVPSDDPRRAHPYKVCWNEDEGLWECECESGQFALGRGQSANCKHVRAVMISVLANKAQASQPAVALAERGSMRAEFEAKVAEEEKAQTEEYARYRAEKERRDTEAYEKRVAQRGSMNRQVKMLGGVPMR